MVKKEGIKEKISKLKTKLVQDRYKSTIQRDRRDYVREISFLKKFFKPKEFLLEETDQIKYTGLKKLTATDIYEVQKQSLALLRRVQRKFNNANLNINLKTHDTNGKKRKYTINIKVEKNRKLIARSKHADWDLPRTMHKTIKNLEQEIQHKYKTEGKKRR
ncbi:MAG: hypothetical protein ISS01_00595 [Nanoarchaeota archaeon]|nr:hypothetical protein [Nanoarchaeota archaeon]